MFWIGGEIEIGAVFIGERVEKSKLVLYLLEREVEKSKLVLKKLGSEIDYLTVGNLTK